MKHLKILGLAAVAAIALTALLGAGTASASNLRIFGSGTNLNVGTVIEATLESGNSTSLEDPFGFTISTCPASDVIGKIERTTQTAGLSWLDTPANATTGPPRGTISTLLFTNCPVKHDVTVLVNGELEVRNIAGTTNGTVISYGAKVSVFNTLLNQTCIVNTGAGTDLGTLTAATSATAKATMDINGLLPLEGCSASSGRWTGKYEVTKPLGLVTEA